MDKEKQIEELTNELVFTSNYGTYNAVANYLVNKGYCKQNKECEKRIANQREEIRRLHMRVNALTQSREVWKQQADRVGEQLHKVLSKQKEGVWAIFDDIDKIAYRYLNDADYSGGDMIYDLNELKKKYTEAKDEG